MQDNELMKNISLGDLWSIFVRRLWIILAAALLCAAVMFAAVQLTFVPKYSSTATMYILRQTNGELSSAEASTDFSAALKVVNDCTYILRSHTVIDEVISTLSLDKTYNELYKAISAENPSDTRVLEVTVVAESPEAAKEIVDSVCAFGAESINRAMGFEQVNVFELGTYNELPSNTVGAKVYMIASLCAALITYAVFVLIFLLDNSIRTAEDIEQYLGLSLLGEIPSANAYRRKAYVYGEKNAQDKESKTEG